VKSRWPSILALAGAVTLACADAVAQTATVVSFPQPANFYQNTTVALDGANAYVLSFDNDVLWSFTLDTGALLDPDGLALPAPATASDAFRFAGGRLAIPGWFPTQGVLVADVSDPTDLKLVGVISLPNTTNIQGQNIEADTSGRFGFVASFPNDTLYSIDVAHLTLADPNGLALPGNPDRIALAGDRLAIVDTTNGRLMVADVGDPFDLKLAGTIALPAGTTFGSNDDIVFAADGVTGFVSSNQRVLYSFDVQTLSLVDPNGVAFGSTGFGDDVAIHGDTLACVSSGGLTFVDASTPSNLTVIANAAFGGTVGVQGDSRACFSSDGSLAAVPIVFPADQVRVFEVATGNPIGAPFAVDDQPNFMATLGATNRLVLVCSGIPGDDVWLIDGLLGSPEITSYCTAKTSSCGGLPAIGYSGIPSASASQGFEIAASGARPTKSGLLLHGPNGPAALPFQGGLLCIAPQGLRRSPAVLAIGGTPGLCDAAFALDMNAFASGHAGGNPQPFLLALGQDVYTQWWGRDTVANGSYLSDGLWYVVSP